MFCDRGIRLILVARPIAGGVADRGTQRIIESTSLLPCQEQNRLVPLKDRGSHRTADDRASINTKGSLFAPKPILAA